jgi:hypothetical protein
MMVRDAMAEKLEQQALWCRAAARWPCPEDCHSERGISGGNQCGNLASGMHYF